MFKESLSSDEGMLFVFEKEDMHSFWMLNMKFPLEIIWISQEGRVVYIAKSLYPCDEGCESIIPREKARYVLEVNAGFVDKYNVSIGEKVDF